MMKKTMAVVLAATMGLSLAACGGQEAPSNPVTTEAVSETAGESQETGGESQSAAETGKVLEAELEYWSNWSETENQALALREAAGRFMAENPGVKINFTFNGRDNRNLVGSAIAAGTKITMMDANADNMRSMWPELMADLTPYFEQSYAYTDGEVYVDTIMPSMAKLSTDLFDGKYTYFPYAPQGFMIFCNKGIFEACGIETYPQTWDEFLEVCETIKNAGYIPVTTDTAYSAGWTGYYLSRLMGEESVFELANNPAAWSDERVLEAARAIEDMAKKGYFDPTLESNTYPNAQQSMVINENIAMYINGTWLPNEVGDTTAEDFTWGAFPFPEVPGGVDGHNAGCYSSYGIAVNKDASPEEMDAAAAFGVYFTSEFDQEFSDMANAIPVQKDGVWPDNLKEAQDVLSNYDVRYFSQTALVRNNNSKQIILDACTRLMGGSLSAEEFQKEASKF